jgi:hypothetical protein
MAANSVYSLLLSMSGGRLLHLQPEDAPGYGDGDILNVGATRQILQKFFMEGFIEIFWAVLNLSDIQP